MLTILPAMPSDFENWSFRTEDIAIQADGGQSEYMLSQSQEAYSIRNVHGQMIGIIGCILQRPGCASAWALMTHRIEKHPIETTKACKKLMESFRRRYQIRRMDMLVNAESERNLKWAVTLGFEEEGELRYFGDQGQSVILLARYWECSDSVDL